MVAYDLRKGKNHKTVQIATTNVADRPYRASFKHSKVFFLILIGILVKELCNENFEKCNFSKELCNACGERAI